MAEIKQSKMTNKEQEIAKRLRQRLDLPLEISDKEILKTTDKTFIRASTELAIALDELSASIKDAIKSSLIFGTILRFLEKQK